MKYYVERGIEFRTMEKTPVENERLDTRMGFTQDGDICVLFGRPVPDLLFTPQEAESFVEAMQKTIAEAKKAKT